MKMEHYFTYQELEICYGNFYEHTYTTYKDHYPYKQDHSQTLVREWSISHTFPNKSHAFKEHKKF